MPAGVSRPWALATYSVRSLNSASHSSCGRAGREGRGVARGWPRLLRPVQVCGAGVGRCAPVPHVVPRSAPRRSSSHPHSRAAGPQLPPPSCRPPSSRRPRGRRPRSLRRTAPSRWLGSAPRTTRRCQSWRARSSSPARARAHCRGNMGEGLVRMVPGVGGEAWQARRLCTAHAWRTHGSAWRTRGGAWRRVART